MRIFSGWDLRQMEPAEVFASSVLDHASIPIELGFLKLDELPLTRRGITTFTYGRFLVPALCGYEGVALFADGCDQLCLGDVAELAALDMSKHAVRVVKHSARGQRRPRVWSSVMLMNCEKLRHWTPEFVERAPDDALMRFGDLPDAAIGDLPPEWNTLVMPGQEPPEGAKIAHWSALSDPNIGDWIDASKSLVWATARERYRMKHAA